MDSAKVTSGPNEMWYLSAYPTWAEMEKATDATDKNSTFTAIDKRQVTTIPLPDSTKAYRIASRQDVGALSTPPDDGGNVRGAVRIAEPVRFWAGSKFLILVQS